MQKLKLGMYSQATSVKGQGVGSAYSELMRLLETYGKDDFSLSVNGRVKECDVIHAHTIDPPSFLSLRFSKKPSVISVHFTPDMADNSIRLPRLFLKVFDWYLIRVYKSADFVHVVNPNLKTELLKYGFSPERIKYIPNFVSKNSFYPMSADERLALRQKYGYREDDFIAFACGQMRQGKGIQDFINTARLVPEVKFIWAGGFSFGKLADGYNETKKMLEELPENVFCPGIVSREEINDLLNISDLFYFPSYQELFPMSILEAASVHLPLLLRDLPEYRNILTGYFLHADTNEEFASRIRSIKNDPDLRQELRAKSAEVSAKYNEESTYLQWKEFYYECAKRKDP